MGGESRPFAGKTYFVQKNTKKKGFFAAVFRHHLTLGRSGGQTVDTRSTSGLPLKSLGYNGSNELCGRSVASKLSPQQPGKKKKKVAMEFREKGKFFVNRS